MNVNGLLDQLRHTFHNERDKSTTFEELICNCFKHDPVYASQISDVWMWKDFPRLWSSLNYTNTLKKLFHTV